MIGNTNNTNDNCLCYKCPEIKEILPTWQGVLCQSKGNDSMGEYDFGDGGFSEE